uniref:N-acetyltransferase domain-containing protein n=1 Tax=Amphiprion percula TaxID=161767 RepID=A0A3P8SNP0_AMPPE
MVRLELDQVVMRRMKDEDIEMVKALIKEGSEGTENRLILHISPVLSASSSWPSSPPSCAALVHSFILPLAIPVFLLIIFLKITMPRSTGVLGSSRPYWDYVGSSHRGGQDETLQNPYCRISGKTPANKKTRRRIGSRDKEKEASTEKISPEREQAAGQVFVADSDGEILGCIFREADTRPGVSRICRLVTGCWYRRRVWVGCWSRAWSRGIGRPEPTGSMPTYRTHPRWARPSSGSWATSCWGRKPVKKKMRS